jgi:signal transduction histidine kinase
MSHELRTPLNAIIGFAELMHSGKVGPLSEQQAEYLGDILVSSRHLLHLINDVLDTAKFESGQMQFTHQPVDLGELVDEILDALRSRAENRHLAVECEVDGSIGEVVVDPARVKQILYNFLSNAIKFSPDGGRIRVRVAPDGPDRFGIEVEDAGVGIAPDLIPHLFKEFTQLDASTAKRYQGAGLGLALTRRIAEGHGGQVSVRSAPGEGSTFRAVLPRQSGGERPAGVR